MTWLLVLHFLTSGREVQISFATERGCVQAGEIFYQENLGVGEKVRFECLPAGNT